ncbi:MAG TPA: hypothetical protein VGO70_08675 [Arsenicitalea sp.]|jgi:predicted Rossmann-fold nucleotide-binding protein|nr:hypothetical protein [Arsenicitalea sp.]
MITKPTLAVFASDKGPGTAERASIMSQAGTFFAKKGARILCLAEQGIIPVPLITSARAAGGEVIIVADEEFAPPRALSGIPLVRVADLEERLLKVAELTSAFIGLPGSLASASNLYRTWVRAGGGASGKPVVLYNRNQAFEVLRGYAADVLSHSISHHERIIQFADSIDDVWNRVNRLLGEVAK